MARKQANRNSSRKKSSPASGRGGQISLPRARVLLALVVIALLGWGMQSVWRRVGPTVIQQEHHLLAAERITATPCPEWITTDVCDEVVRDAGLDRRLSLLDESFVQVIEDAFVLHPWVERVERITKDYPRGVRLELIYRRPVAVVELSGNDGVLFVPVDRHGVHLPTDDVPVVRKRYLPRIGGIVGRPPVGQQWPDPRVIGAVRLASQLQEFWEPLHLVDILPSARPEIRDEHRFFVYDLITRGGTRIVWGAVSDVAPPEEDSFEEKLARLQRCVEQHGPLNSVRSPAVVDVRRTLEITPRTVKKPPAADEEAPLVK